MLVEVRPGASNGLPVTSVTVLPSMTPYAARAPDWNRHHLIAKPPSRRGY
jgi:hypothetical protein